MTNGANGALEHMFLDRKHKPSFIGLRLGISIVYGGLHTGPRDLLPPSPVEYTDTQQIKFTKPSNERFV